MSEKEARESVYCLFCETTQEKSVEENLRKAGYSVISIFAERKLVKNGQIKQELRPIIPGYVFFENKIEPNWDEMSNIRHVFYPLKYSNNEKRLRGRDLEFAQWLKTHNGTIKISKVVDIGRKIKIIEGPLKDYEGKIIKVNKRQKCAAIKIDGEGLEFVIWLSYEYIDLGEKDVDRLGKPIYSINQDI